MWILFYSLRVFHTISWGCFSWSFSNNKFPLVLRTLLINQADFNSAVIWLVSILPLISNSSSFLARFLGTVPRVLTISFTVTSMFHRFFTSLARSRYLSASQLLLFSLCVLLELQIHILLVLRRCLWCNGYRRRKWTRRHEFKSWTRMIAFYIALLPLGKVWIQLFSLQLWVK